MSHPIVDVGKVALQPATWPPLVGEVLGCSDYLQKIIECINEVGEFPKRDLVNFALANKFFVNPVMDTVWKTMHTLTPFFLLFPVALTSYSNGTKARPLRAFLYHLWIWAYHTSPIQIIMTRVPATSDETFNSYAYRLRHLAFKKDVRSENLPPLSVIRLALLQPNGIPFFPRLESLSFSYFEVSQATAAYTELIALSPITKLELTDLHTETATFVTVLSLFSLRFAGALKELRMRMPDPGRAFTMESLRFLPHLTDLTTLSITCPYPHFPIYDLLKWITGLRNLETLEIDVRPRLTAPIIAGLRSEAQSLRFLRIGGPFGFIMSVLRMFTDIGECIELAPSRATTELEDTEIIMYVERTFSPSPELLWKELPEL
ncbi:hypothetical protein DFP72DRAFT_889775 [Ephemerocybe angulata]|uniref:Uncharacterized protein n=1 Tax=Ephemerocybe angulata TaxID=980116 RepID=A0A8H6M6W6_9AGAR|nr:hypothetical protein DFP72DRAFT_889775 [Tulosesus angulatus]